jgi:hypothetical protein
MATTKQEAPKATIQQQLDAITFKNSQAEKIKAVQEGKQRLKDNLGRNKQRYVSSTEGVGNHNRRVSAAGRMAGLQTLGK